MDKEVVEYTLPMLSSLLELDPKVEFNDMDISISLVGYNNDSVRYKVKIKFRTVIGYKQTFEGFTRIGEAYDQIVSVSNSKWLRDLNKASPNRFKYWQPRHFRIYLDDYGLYECVAQTFEIEETIIE